jgi:DAK2 domain fusion protein YloV
VNSLNRQHIDGPLFRQMIRTGSRYLTQQVDTINALNVFPVPDGDTGTNMNMTFVSGVQEMDRRGNLPLGQSADALSKGLLMGARGNSGVILSQLFRGFAKASTGLTQMDTKQFADALQNGVQTAYQAVVKPVEGTILTVSKDAAKEAVDYAKKTTDVVELMSRVLEKAKESLARTPDLLPVLKKVGVVDSGGQGLVTVYEGFLAVLKGQESVDAPSIVTPATGTLNETVLQGHDAHPKSAQAHISADAIEHGY